MRTPKTITAAEAQLLEYRVFPRSELCAVFKVDPAVILLNQAEQLLAPHTARFNALLAVVAAEHNLSPDALTRADKTRPVMAAKRDAVALALEILSPPFDPESLGTWFNLSRSAMYRLLAETREKAQHDSAFAARLEKLRPRVSAALASLNPKESSNG